MIPPEHQQINAQKHEDSLLLRHFGGNADAVVTFRNRMDRLELSRLRMAIACGSGLDNRGGRPRTPATAPPIDKAKLAAWLRAELGKIRDECQGMIREEVGAAKHEVEIAAAEAIEERFMRMEGRIR